MTDLLSLKNLNLILSDYNLGKIKTFEELSKGSVQKNILIQTTNGAVVLKYYINRTIQYVEFETKLLEFLHKKSYFSPKVNRTNNEDLLTNWFGKAIVITEYIKGEHKEKLSEFEFNQLIAKIAELHLLTKNLKIDGFENRWNYNIDFCKEYLNTRTEYYRKARQLKKKRWLEVELGKLEIPQSIPTGIVHGDLQNSNIIFTGNKIKALIDFDDANYSYLLFDILNLIDNKRTEESFLNKEYFKISKEVINKYQRKRTLGEIEKRSLFDVLILSIIIDSFWFYKRGKFPDFKEKNKIYLLRKMGRNKFYENIFS